MLVLKLLLQADRGKIQSSPFTSKVPSGRDAAAVADMRVPHEPWNSRDHVQLVGDAPAVGNALIVGASKGCISDPGGVIIVHRDARPLPCPYICSSENRRYHQQSSPVWRCHWLLYRIASSNLSKHVERARHLHQHAMHHAASKARLNAPIH